MAVVELIFDVKDPSWVTGNTNVPKLNEPIFLSDFRVAFGDGSTQVQNLVFSSFIPESQKNQSNGVVALDSTKQIILSSSVNGAYNHDFKNTNSAGYAYFRALNDQDKEMAFVVFGSAFIAGPSLIYKPGSAWASATASEAGIINEQAGGVIIFAAGGSDISNEVFRITSSLMTISKSLMITSGAPGLGKVLTSDASGNATWQSPSASSPLVAYQNIDSTVTGTTSRTIVANLKINANTMGPNGFMHIFMSCSKTGLAGTASFRVIISPTSNSFASGAEFSALTAMNANIRTQCFRLKMVNKNSQALNNMSDVTTTFPEIASTNNRLVRNVNWAVDQWVVVTITLANAADTATLDDIQIFVFNP